MKFLDYIFSSLFVLFDTISPDRPENVESPVIATISTLVILSILNILSFFTPDTSIGRSRICFAIVIISCCILIMRFYVKKRYINVVNHFKSKSNKDLYYLITVAYVIISIVAFAMTR